MAVPNSNPYSWNTNRRNNQELHRVRPPGTANHHHHHHLTEPAFRPRRSDYRTRREYEDDDVYFPNFDVFDYSKYNYRSQSSTHTRNQIPLRSEISSAATQSITQDFATLQPPTTPPQTSEPQVIQIKEECDIFNQILGFFGGDYCPTDIDLTQSDSDIDDMLHSSINTTKKTVEYTDEVLSNEDAEQKDDERNNNASQMPKKGFKIDVDFGAILENMKNQPLPDNTNVVEMETCTDLDMLQDYEAFVKNRKLANDSNVVDMETCTEREILERLDTNASYFPKIQPSKPKPKVKYRSVSLDDKYEFSRALPYPDPLSLFKTDGIPLHERSTVKNARRWTSHNSIVAEAPIDVEKFSKTIHNLSVFKGLGVTQKTAYFIGMNESLITQLIEYDEIKRISDEGDDSPLVTPRKLSASERKCQVTVHSTDPRIKTAQRRRSRDTERSYETEFKRIFNIPNINKNNETIKPAVEVKKRRVSTSCDKKVKIKSECNSEKNEILKMIHGKSIMHKNKDTTNISQKINVDKKSMRDVDNKSKLNVERTKEKKKVKEDKPVPVPVPAPETMPIGVFTGYNTRLSKKLRKSEIYDPAAIYDADTENVTQPKKRKSIELEKPVAAIEPEKKKKSKKSKSTHDNKVKKCKEIDMPKIEHEFTEHTKPKYRLHPKFANKTKRFDESKLEFEPSTKSKPKIVLHSQIMINSPVLPESTIVSGERHDFEADLQLPTNLQDYQTNNSAIIEENEGENQSKSSIEPQTAEVNAQNNGNIEISQNTPTTDFILTKSSIEPQESEGNNTQNNENIEVSQNAPAINFILTKSAIEPQTNEVKAQDNGNIAVSPNAPATNFILTESALEPQTNEVKAQDNGNIAVSPNAPATNFILTESALEPQTNEVNAQANENIEVSQNTPTSFVFIKSLSEAISNNSEINEKSVGENQSSIESKETKRLTKEVNAQNNANIEVSQNSVKSLSEAIISKLKAAEVADKESNTPIVEASFECESNITKESHIEFATESSTEMANESPSEVATETPTNVLIESQIDDTYESKIEVTTTEITYESHNQVANEYTDAPAQQNIENVKTIINDKKDDLVNITYDTINVLFPSKTIDETLSMTVTNETNQQVTQMTIRSPNTNSVNDNKSNITLPNSAPSTDNNNNRYDDDDDDVCIIEAPPIKTEDIIIKIEDDDEDAQMKVEKIDIKYIKMEAFIVNITQHYTNCFTQLSVYSETLANLKKLKEMYQQPTRLLPSREVNFNVLDNLMKAFMKEVNGCEVLNFSTKNLVESLSELISASRTSHICVFILLILRTKTPTTNFGKLFCNEVVSYCCDHAEEFSSTVQSALKSRLNDSRAKLDYEAIEEDVTNIFRKKTLEGFHVTLETHNKPDNKDVGSSSKHNLQINNGIEDVSPTTARPRSPPASLANDMIMFNPLTTNGQAINVMNMPTQEENVANSQFAKQSYLPNQNKHIQQQQQQKSQFPLQAQPQQSRPQSQSEHQNLMFAQNWKGVSPPTPLSSGENLREYHTDGCCKCDKCSKDRIQPPQTQQQRVPQSSSFDERLAYRRYREELMAIQQQKDKLNQQLNSQQQPKPVQKLRQQRKKKSQSLSPPQIVQQPPQIIQQPPQIIQQPQIVPQQQMNVQRKDIPNILIPRQDPKIIPPQQPQLNHQMNQQSPLNLIAQQKQQMVPQNQPRVSPQQIQLIPLEQLQMSSRQESSQNQIPHNQIPQQQSHLNRERQRSPQVLMTHQHPQTRVSPLLEPENPHNQIAHQNRQFTSQQQPYINAERQRTSQVLMTQQHPQTRVNPFLELRTESLHNQIPHQNRQFTPQQQAYINALRQRSPPVLMPPQYPQIGLTPLQELLMIKQPSIPQPVQQYRHPMQQRKSPELLMHPQYMQYQINRGNDPSPDSSSNK